VKTFASTPSINVSTAFDSSEFSSASAIGSTRTSECDTSLSHQSLETSAIVAPPGCAVTTLRASVSCAVTVGANGFE
jgi:hypothetical protein